MTHKVTIYAKDYCPYCKRAKALLRAKGVTFTEYEVTDNAELFQEMLERSNGGRTVPQIFIGDKHIGGSSDLFDLEESGELDSLLGLIQTA